MLSTVTNNDESGPETQHSYELATAVLLVEMARADADVTTDEIKAIINVVSQSFELSKDESSALLEVAQSRADESTSLHEFTSTLKEQLDKPQRCRMIELLWQVAYADGELDRYEDHFVRKIADLLYLKHSEFMQAKHRTQKRLGIS